LRIPASAAAPSITSSLDRRQLAENVSLAHHPR
jgi:hypothetical protein